MQAWFLKYDAAGNLLTEKNFGGSADDSGNKLIQTSDGGYLIVGSTKSFGMKDGLNDVWLLKLDSHGDTLWTKTYDLGHDDMGTDIIPFHGNNYLITAVSCTADCGGLLQQGFAAYLVVDSAGNLLSTATFKQGPKNKFSAISPTSDGGAILTGATSSREKFPSEDIWIVKLDANADASWTKIIGGYGRYDGGFSIFQAPDSGYFLAAYSQTLNTPQMDFDNWWLLRLNSVGDTLWTRWWGGTENDDPYSVIPTSDGGIIMAGFKDAVSWPLSEVPGPADFYVIKTNSLGMVTRITDPLNDHPHLNTFALYQNYPNPFNPTTTIRFSLPSQRHVTLKVFDVQGREMAKLVDGELTVGEHSVVFEAEGLPSGVYFYRLTTSCYSEAKPMEKLK